MNEEYAAFFNACIAKLDVDPEQCRMRQNYCQIRTARGWVVHYEWWLTRGNNLRVCLHFESNQALNQRRYGACALLINALNGRIAQNSTVTHGRHGANWRHITITRKLDFRHDDAVTWAVSMMRVLREVFGRTVDALE
jgi:hypothetical protein